MIGCRGALSLLAALSLAACDDGAVEVSSEPEQTVGPEASSDAGEWLTPADDRRPGAWLAELDAAAHAGSGEARAADYAVYGALLTRAGRYYHETPRMIANRIAQLHREVAPMSPDLTIAMLLSDFAWEAGNERPQTLGEVGQHYLVLRREGVAHPDAMDKIRAAYGARPVAD